MTETNYRKSFRALFLTALMVISVFGGTIAFAGGAAAAIDSSSISSPDPAVVQGGDDVTVTGSPDTTDFDAYVYVDLNDNGEFDSGERFSTVGIGDTSDFQTTFSAPAESALENPSATQVYVVQQDGGLSTGDVYPGDANNPGALTVDDTAPTFENAAPTGTSNEASPTITVDIVDEVSGVSASDISVTVSDGSSTLLDAAGTGDGAVSFDGTEVEITPGSGSLSALSDGTSYTYSVTATDAAGNEATSDQFSFEYDTSDPSFGTATFGDDTELAGATLTTTTPTLTLPISDDGTGVDAESIDVTLEDDSGVLYTYSIGSEDADDGVTFSGGELTVEAGTGGVPSLAAGDSYTLTVSAADEAGNSPSDASVDFTVDTDGPVIDLSDVPVGTTDNAEPTFDVGVGDAESATLEIRADGSTIETFTTENTDVFSAGTFTVNAGPDGDIRAFENGEEITVAVTEAVGPNGNTNNDESTSFTVDTQGPTATDVSTNFGGSYTTSTTDGEISVTFDEPVDPDTVTVTVGEATLNTDDLSDDDHAADPAATTAVTFDYSVADGVDESRDVAVTAAEDEVTNPLAADDTDVTISIDTEAPMLTVNPINDGDTDGQDGIASGSVDLTEDVTASSDDGETVSYAVLPGGDGSYDATDDEGNLITIENPANVNTNAYPDGVHTLVVTVTDDAGNAVTETSALTIDNTDPSVTFAEDTTLTGEVTLGDLVTVEGLGVESATVNVYNQQDDTAGDADTSVALEDADETTIDINELGSGDYTVEVVADNPGYDGAEQTVTASQTFTGEKLSPGTLSIDTADDVTGAEGDSSTLVVSYVSDTNLDELNVTVGTLDDYVEQSSTEYTIEDFTESEDAGTYTYTLTQETTRDGVHEVAFDDARVGEQTLLADDFAMGEDTATVDIDTRAIEMIDADVSGVDAGRTQVTVTFSEPVEAGTVAQTAFSFNGNADIIGVTDATQYDGEQTVTFDSEIQTGTGAELTFTDTNPTDDVESSVVVDSVELDLSEGANLVSVPVETGEVALDSIDLSDVNVVWAYDNGAWESYDPDASENAFTALEGGQGYIFVAEADTTVDARGYTVPAADTSGDQPTVPTAEGLDEGWNLVGHFQEGTQTLGDYGPLNAVDSTVAGVGPLGQAGTGYSYVTVSEFAPGEAYWVFTDSSDVYTAVDYDNTDSATTPSIDSASAEGAADDNGEVNSGEQITVSATVSNANSVTVNAEWLNEMKTLEQTDGTGPYTATFDVPAGVSDGSKTLTVTARDSVGAEDTEPASVTLNRNLDSLTLDTPDETNDVVETLSASDTIEVSASDAQSVGPLEVTITDVDDNEVDSGTITTSEGYSYSGLSDGRYTATVTAQQQTGSTSADFRIDSTTASVTGISADPNPATSQNPTTDISFTLNDLSADGNDDTVSLVFPDDVTLNPNSVSEPSSLVTSSLEVVDGPNGGTDNELTFALDQDDANTYSPNIVVDTDIDYPSDGSYPVDLDVSDSDGDSIDNDGFLTLDVDSAAPQMIDAEGQTTTTEVELYFSEDITTGEDNDLQAADLTYTDASGDSVSITNNGVTYNQATNSATVTLSGDYAVEDSIALADGVTIKDDAGNTASGLSVTVSTDGTQPDTST
ncbi:hypothetical protein DM867_02335 [Halosegnis rubeus]|uniref:Uncharacterized protein n=1 Tax=Halosegnis rubeus TaxID=2212850 RepID=A0A5N5UEW8_9EURY|nr:surface glycoprotein [Halosegnis rubeus]KAB7516002.1 hypothetical protein DM867_02335 [Halosegnis rubeus]